MWFRSFLNLVLLERALSQPSSGGWPLLSRPLNSMRSSSLWLLHWPASRLGSLLRGLLLWSVRVGFLVGVLLYVACSFAADYDYAQGMRTHDPIYFDKAATLFPLMRDRRSGPAYLAIVQQDLRSVGKINEALRYDPNAADLYFGLTGMRLRLGDQQGYSAALTQLRKLTPGVEYRILTGG